MTFERAGTANGEMTYSRYLQLDRLLGLQQPLTVPRHDDELHFVVVHQAMELWFKAIIAELHLVVTRLEADDWAGALRRMKRASAMSEAQLAQLRTLATLDPVAFSFIRGFLGTASGFQSTQFRVVETLSGLRDPEYLETLRRHLGALPVAVTEVLAAPSVAQAADAALGRTVHTSWADVHRRPDESGVVLLLAEELVEFDRIWMQWRYEHLVVVERIIGRLTRGTGGALPSYLESRVAVRFFPQLWDARHDLQHADAGV